MTGDLKTESADHVDLLRKVQSLSSLDDNILEQIAQVASHKSVKRGENLVGQGEPANSFYIVLVDCLVGEKPIAEIAMGEPIGELAFLPAGRALQPSKQRETAMFWNSQRGTKFWPSARPKFQVVSFANFPIDWQNPFLITKLFGPCRKACAVFPGGAEPLAPEFGEANICI